MKFIYYLRLMLALALFGCLASLVHQTHERSAIQQQRKYDDANINHMKYGLFNINSWKEKLSSIIVAEIEEFQLNNANKSDLKKHVEGQLNTLIDKLDNQIKESNQNTTKGWLKKKFIDAFFDMKDIKQGIPNYADTIVQEMTHKESQKKLKEVIKGRVGKYLEETFEPLDMSEVNDIIQRSGQKDRQSAVLFLEKVVPFENGQLFSLTWKIIASAVLLFLVAAFHRSKIPAPFFFLCLGTLLLLLYAGVTCPMIDMVARISKFDFVLLGHPVEFHNQIVYFQSKSILDVFWILMDHADWKMKCVGVLMILFSIVFPVTKILCSILYYYDIFGSQKRWLVNFFVLKSGKWSMTDVVVVAIMMAYVGFNGMVKSQFETLRATIPQFNMISTNDTTLQIGVYIFLCYVILAMILALLIEKRKA
jgi:hypothetical protein